MRWLQSEAIYHGMAMNAEYLARHVGYNIYTGWRGRGITELVLRYEVIRLLRDGVSK